MAKAGTLDIRSAATRARLIAAGERLFSRYGVDSVSLVEIVRAAGQRNRNALQYHFGDRRGLLQAILDKHMPAVTRERHRILDDLEEGGAVTLRGLVDAMVRPVAAKLDDPDGGPAFVSIQAQLAARSTLAHYEIDHPDLQTEGNERLSRLFSGLLGHLPPAVMRQRMALAVSLMFHGLSDHAALEEIADDADVGDGRALLLENLLDSIAGLLGAPVSPATEGHLPPR